MSRGLDRFERTSGASQQEMRLEGLDGSSGPHAIGLQWHDDAPVVIHPGAGGRVLCVT